MFLSCRLEPVVDVGAAVGAVVDAVVDAWPSSEQEIRTLLVIT